MSTQAKADPTEALSTLRAARLLSTIDEQMARGLGRLVGEARSEVLLAAAVASRATRQGHVCLELTKAAGFSTDEEGVAHAAFPEASAWRDLLATSPLVGAPEQVDRPLVLADHRLYLRRYHTYEQRLAESIERRIAHVEKDIDGKLLKQGLDRLFGSQSGDARDLQRLAALVAVMRRFCVISGGPGTGKTTTVTKILALLQEQAMARRNKKLQILLVAPTGKAAARLRESIEKARGNLDCEPRIRDLIPSEATTIHRRLSPIAGSMTRFRHDADSPLACDVLLVDEASMVDLPLMTRLLDALPEHARLILLGDRNQLASVEAGAVLGDICGPALDPAFSSAFAERIFKLVGESVPTRAESEPSPAIADCVVQLEKSWRFGENSGIRHLAIAVNAGDGDTAVKLLESGDYPDIALCAGATEKGLGRALRSDAVEGYRPYLEASAPPAAAHAFGTYRVLCAHRTGPFGVEMLNPLFEAALDEERLLRASGRWYEHRPVLVMENDYAVSLYNGDVGITLQDADGVRVHFVSADGSEDRALAPSRLPRHETVFAMTVHKAQGSEFDRLAFVLPDTATKVLTKELVYTAVTRAMTRVTVFGGAEVLRAAAARAVDRASGLRDRLWGAR
jgi:exodeoxyribonuclease V alpha subunit